MYTINNSGVLENWRFLMGDVIAIELALLLSYLLRGYIGDIGNASYYLVLGVLSIVLLIALAFFSDNYRFIRIRTASKELIETLTITTYIFALIIGLFFVFKLSEDISRFIIIFWYCMSILLIFMSRQLIKHKWIPRVNDNEISKVLIIADNSVSDEELIEIRESASENYQIRKICFLDENRNLNNCSCIAGVNNIENTARKIAVDEVLFLTEEYDPKIDQLIKQLVSMGITVHFGLSKFLFERLPKTYLQEINGIKVITKSSNYISDRELFIKRAIDIVASIFGLIATAFITVVIGPIIYISSPGPIFFKQTRMGKNGRKFNFYKFRSMYVDAEERKKELMIHNNMDGYMFKMKDDPRITPIGKFIRKTSIDEFPQFWNILKGDMSLIGTRPPTVDEFEQYLNHHKGRLAMKPGLTGMWQASGRSEITNFEEVVELDREYIVNWSLGLDFKIFFKTVLMVLGRKGAS